MKFKPMLACDADLSKVKFPVIIQPKVDGVRALNLDGKLVGRSLKPFANKAVTELLSKPELSGLDGELVCRYSFFEDKENCCRNTTSIMNTIEGHDDVIWLVYDDFTLPELPYWERLNRVEKRVKELSLGELANRVFTIYNFFEFLDEFDEQDQVTLGYVFAEHSQRVEQYMEHMLNNKQEGLILRGKNNPYKFGRSTQKEGGLLRLKEFKDAEAEVISLQEGFTNNNPATINELGLTERSSHKENKIPNGKIGSLVCKDLESGEEIIVGAGKLTDEERKYYFDNSQEIVGRIIKYKFFPTGGKEKPRFPTFQTFRIKEDMSK